MEGHNYLHRDPNPILGRVLKGTPVAFKRAADFRLEICAHIQPGARAVVGCCIKTGGRLQLGDAPEPAKSSCTLEVARSLGCSHWEQKAPKILQAMEGTGGTWAPFCGLSLNFHLLKPPGKNEKDVSSRDRFPLKPGQKIELIISANECKGLYPFVLSFTGGLPKVALGFSNLLVGSLRGEKTCGELWGSICGPKPSA